MNFLEENTEIVIDRMAATPYDFVLAAEHAAIANSSNSNNAHVAELVDAHGSGPCAFGCGGSSPSVGTTTSGELFIAVVRSNSSSNTSSTQ